MFSVSLPMGTQMVDQRTLQRHRAPNASSDLLFKNALYDQAQSVFSGLIVVDEGAHATDAYQTCRNLLASDQAQAHSLPGLEILADQVKCSHGSTSGPMDAEELFYLRARGIDEALARQLIARGFVAQVISRLGDEAWSAALLKAVDEKLEARA
jgi:Fe-S cluster assembly protein SufD